MPTRKDSKSSAFVGRAILCKELITTGDDVFGYLKSSHEGDRRWLRVRVTERLVGDKAYSAEKVRGYLRRRGIGMVIPYRANQPENALFDRRLYRERNRIERLINRLKQFRRIATRYEKRAANYLAMLTVAAILLWL